ncbi:uncharacterized protein TNCV_141891 [Trichonephila clavipes]|nr:uncharacterized protein TNCV_141891 [Trichonephila clavipes]
MVSSACQALCSRAHCRHSRRWLAVKGILYEGTFARNPRCSRRQRIDEADISTPVAVDQRATNYLEEAVRSFTAMRKRCRSLRADVIFRRPLSVFRVVRCSSFVQTRRMPNSPSRMISDMLDRRQIWGSCMPRKGTLVTPLPCEVEHCLVENGSCEPLHKWRHMWLQDARDIPLSCHGATDQD